MQEQQVLRAPPGLREPLVLQGQLVTLDPLVRLATPVLLVRPATQALREQLVQPAPLGRPAQPELVARQETLVPQVRPATQALREQLVLQGQLVTLDPLVRLAT